MPTIEELQNLLSMQGGQLDALTAVLVAVCETVPRDSEGGKLFALRLEESIAGKLQMSTNQPYLDSFERTAELLIASLKT